MRRGERTCGEPIEGQILKKEKVEGKQENIKRETVTVVHAGGRLSKPLLKHCRVPALNQNTLVYIRMH